MEAEDLILLQAKGAVLEEIVREADSLVQECCCSDEGWSRRGFCENFGCTTLLELIAPARRFHPYPTSRHQELAGDEEAAM